MHIRQLAEADAASFWSLRLRALREYPLYFSADYEEAARVPLEQAAARLTASADGCVFGALDDDGAVIGAVGLRRDGQPELRHQAMIWGMIVAPERQGNGIGHMLLEALIEHAGRMPGVERLYLTVTDTNTAAIRLYRSFGFEPYGSSCRIAARTGQRVDETHMALTLRREAPPVALPGDLAERIGHAAWQTVTIGCSAARTFRLIADGETTYVKVMERKDGQTLVPEHERLQWLQGKLLVPRVLAYGEESGREALWLSAVPGLHAADRSWSDRLPQLVRSLAAGLRLVHALPVAGCPFDRRLTVRLREAEERVRNGSVDAADFDAVRLGRTAEELFEELLATVPDAEDLVFTHGDYCLPNVLIDGEGRCGYIDWGGAGIADRYQDIALAVRSLTSNFGAQWGEMFIERYGLAEPDRARLAFYQLLDEFF